VYTSARFRAARCRARKREEARGEARVLRENGKGATGRERERERERERPPRRLNGAREINRRYALKLPRAIGQNENGSSPGLEMKRSGSGNYQARDIIETSARNPIESINLNDKCERCQPVEQSIVFGQTEDLRPKGRKENCRVSLPFSPSLRDHLFSHAMLN